MSIKGINWRELLTTPYPRTGWGLSAETMVVLHEDRKAGQVCAHAPVPEGAFDLGPVGLNAVDGDLLTSAVRSLQERIGGSRRPSVVVPNSWVRLHLLDFDEAPGRQAELEEVVRWRLKKLLPIRPAELRIDAQAEKIPEGGWKVLSVSGVARAWEDLESAFEAAGLQPALLTPSIFALGEGVPRELGETMVVQVEPGMMAMIARVHGRLGLVHTRLLPPSEGAWAVVARELRTTRLFLSERLGIEGPVRVVPAAMDPGAADALRRACEAVEGLEVLPPPSAPPCAGIEERGRSILSTIRPVVGGRPA